MLTTQAMSDRNPSDADLVHASLAGNRGAFGQIVARYQSLICSLAYSATGSLDRSEDLAQETFLAAWQRLASLHEPSKLRAWLCGIARRLISNAQRQASHEPAHLAEAFEPGHEMATSEPSPPEQVVSREEAAILWRALEQIPETYREPLVLFYREQRSVESVAHELDLSADAVKQRLARGRTMLHEQVLALVESTLERSRPGQAFLLGVMAALPVLGPGVVAASAVTTKSAASAKSAAWLTPWGTLLTAQVLWFVSSLAFVAGIGGFIGWQLADPAASAAEHRWARHFWRFFVLGLGVFLLPVMLLDRLLAAHPQYAGGFALWFSLLYIVPGVPFLLWALANHQRVRGAPAEESSRPVTIEPPFLRWATVATVIMSGMFAYNFAAGHWVTRIPPDRVWALVSSQTNPKIRVDLLETGNRWVEITLSESGKARRYFGPLDTATLARMESRGLPYETRVQGRDYDILGWPGRRFGLVTILIPAMGGGLWVRRQFEKRKQARRTLD
ncbi:MAG TPA: sigma-70 family RNA polymerase sigma factor [Lacunisphaera sp.]|nr:sigma-70 family RNA polymerase sigma factor [Lacunisphaera sp.]